MMGLEATASAFVNNVEPHAFMSNGNQLYFPHSERVNGGDMVYSGYALRCGKYVNKLSQVNRPDTAED